MNLELKRIDKPFVFCLKNEAGHKCLMDASEAVGGRSTGFRPMELLAGSLAGCAAIDIINILNKQKIEPKLFQIEIEAIRKEDIPADFSSIELVIYIDPEIDRVKLHKTVKLVLEKHCSVLASLNKEIKIDYKIIDQDEKYRNGYDSDSSEEIC